MPHGIVSKTRNADEAVNARAIPRLDPRSLDAIIGSEQAAVQFRSKKTVFQQGGPADAVFYLKKGKVRIAVVSKQGKEAIVAIHEAGEFFGEGCLAGQSLRLASAVAIEDATIVRIEKGKMVGFLHERPAFAETFMAFLLSRNVQVEADLVDQLFNSSERRLARMLLLLANFGKEGKMERVIPKISQGVLAARVGTTRSRINFFMNKFRKLGFIEYNGELKVHSSLMSMVVHE